MAIIRVVESNSDCELSDSESPLTNIDTPPPTPISWTIGNDLLNDGAGRLSVICPLSSVVERCFPLLLLNSSPCFQEENQDYYERFKASSPFHVILHTEDTSPIPRILLEDYLFPHIESRPLRTSLPFTSHQPNRTVDCTVDRIDNHLLPASDLDCPTFRYSSAALPSLMIRQDVWVRLTYHSDQTARSTPKMRVRSTKGFILDHEYEVLELEVLPAAPINSVQTVLLFMPPPFIHVDVPISIEANSYVRQEYYLQSAIWTQKEFGSVTAVLTKEQDEKRTMTVLKLIQRKNLAFRCQQC